MGSPTDWDERRFRPRIGRRPKEERVPRFRVQVLRALQKHGGGTSGAHTTGQRRCGVVVRAPHASSRRCVIKGRYVTMRENGWKAARLHLTYLERDGVERDGAPGRLYGADSTFDRDAFGRPLEGEQRQFRFIVSPEDGDSLDLTAFARELMGRVEKDLGRGLVWAAVNHHNTDNPHVHVVIRGVDADGDDLRIDGRYIGREMRWRAQEVITRELGPRPELGLGFGEMQVSPPEIDAEPRARLARHVPGSHGRGPVLQPGERFETIDGTVRGLGLHDELAGTMYVVVERPGRDACYVPLPPDSAEKLMVGDHVRVTCPAESWVKATDRIVARVAAEQGGIYDPTAHERALSMRGHRDGAAGQPTPKELVGANVRRLERLERYGLVAREVGGRWRIPSDLVAQLEAREVSHPRHRIQIERVGPAKQVERTPVSRSIGRGRGPGIAR
jgi:hypothetical protein